MKHSTSDLFVANCDEFIFYDDLVTQSQKKKRPAPPPEGTSADPASRRDEAVDLVVSALESLLEERDEDELVWGSMIKQAIRRQRPDFKERAYGFKTFNDVLEEARRRKLLELTADEKSGGYIVREPA